MPEQLATRSRFTEHLSTSWPAFLEKRRQRLVQAERLGHAAERVTEQILEDLFTHALDWTLADINYQVDYADMLLTRLGIKYLVVEAKRPGALAWNRRAVEAALEQAAGYAARQRVRSIAVSDGHMLYAADVVHGGLRDRVFVALDGHDGPEHLWWLSVHGIYREVDLPGARLDLPAKPVATAPGPSPAGSPALLHPRYGLPARCFAYVGDVLDPRTWRLPYRCADGSVDPRRLPKAIQSILTNYRGARVTTVPEAAIPDVLERLASGARELGHMPDQRADAAQVYVLLDEVLSQLGRSSRGQASR